MHCVSTTNDKQQTSNKLKIDSMTDKFKNKYRIPSARWREWDYGTNAAYFVTVCTAHRERFFGEITAGEMTMSEIGKTVQAEWLKTPGLRPDMNLTLGEYVIMPNHFHAIIVIGENPYNTDDGDDNDDDDNDDNDDDAQTRCIASLPQSQPQSQSNKFGPQSKNLASIMRGFKSAVTKFATMNNIPFAWQERFHDRVIRDYGEHKRIVRYICTNIEHWKEDELYE
jgi:REP element-mobilizing transposase RayT